MRAFGDNLTKWGTSTVLIETGPYQADPPDPFLVRLNFVAIVTALEALASGSVNAADPAYEIGISDLGLNGNSLATWGIYFTTTGIGGWRNNFARVNVTGATNGMFVGPMIYNTFSELYFKGADGVTSQGLSLSTCLTSTFDAVTSAN